MLVKSDFIYIASIHSKSHIQRLLSSLSDVSSGVSRVLLEVHKANKLNAPSPLIKLCFSGFEHLLETSGIMQVGNTTNITLI